ncbi:UDP-3-O-(3-hydroxymyristoyl)glucosamine N-acyltransferase [Gilvimarinus sp. F26214L]|uniref:UDP-3-O-(3-hydroxymyristoyl)glucosamine N-acyltransferase n=1 Tax=Gilvimarinus sp. DZF01 TaxID=3461371 RepID=UPI004045CEDC
MSESFPGLSLTELARTIDARIVGDPDTRITGIATLQDARAGQIAFLANSKYRKYLSSTEASAVVLAPDQLGDFAGNALLVDDPYHGYARLSQLFAPPMHAPAGIHPSAVVAEDAIIGQGVSVGPHVTVEPGVIIGDGVSIGSGCHVGAGSRIGSDSRLYPRVTIYHGVSIGARAILHSGVVVGSDGFGFAPHQGQWVKIHQLAGVRIGDDVELGAGTCVDRGALSDTLIGHGVKTDNMVQIAHGVRIGDHTVIAGCAAIAGSTEIGSHCVIAGAVGIVGHLKIVDNVTITAMSLVTKSITQPGSYSSGTPMAPTRQWRKQAVRFAQLDEISNRLKNLEKREP